jgi:hypothetical protein
VRKPRVWFELGEALWAICMGAYKEPVHCSDGRNRVYSGLEINLRRDIVVHMKPGDRIRIEDGEGMSFSWEWNGTRLHQPGHPAERGPLTEGGS